MVGDLLEKLFHTFYKLPPPIREGVKYHHPVVGWFEMVKCSVCKDKLMPDYAHWCSEECFDKICSCAECPDKDHCEYAFNEYNTHGVCLAEK